MALDLVEFTELAGAQVHWGSWGRTGTRRLASHWLPLLDDAFRALFAAWPWGQPQAILSGGAYVPKAGRHGLGTAFDLCGFAWGERDGHPLGRWQQWLLGSKWDTSPGEAIAIEAFLRTQDATPQVLGPQYFESAHRNAPSKGWRHRDHFHADDRESARGFQSGHSSDVRWLQWVLNELWRPAGAPQLRLDGRYGPKTAKALDAALQEIGEPAVPTDGSVWQAFLEATWRAGWGLVEAPQVPSI